MQVPADADDASKVSRRRVVPHRLRYLWIVGRHNWHDDGRPVLEDGRRRELSNVIGCTGFTPDCGRIDLSLPTHADAMAGGMKPFL
jgi:hypothetical protein